MIHCSVDFQQNTYCSIHVNPELPWGFDSMPVSIVDDEIGIFYTADPWPNIPQEVHFTLPHLNRQEIHLHTTEEIQHAPNIMCVWMQ